MLLLLSSPSPSPSPLLLVSFSAPSPRLLLLTRRADIGVGDVRGADVAHAEDEKGEDEDLPCRVSQHELDHDGGEEGLVSRAGRALEQVRGGVLGGEGEGGEGVHDHVDPEELHGSERALGEDGAAHDREDAGRAVDCELKLEELADIIVHVPPPLDSLQDRGEVVVEDDDVSCVLSHLRERG